MNNEERELWVLNDETLYNDFKRSRKSMKVYLRFNREEIDEYIKGQLSQLYLKGDKMRSEKTIRKKLIEKTKLLNSMNADIQPYECEHQSGYIQALYWVLNKTV